ncbi:MAG: SusC/RagA family TonB-linked outer membrane protein [Chitinophagaceae bacterium]
MQKALSSPPGQNVALARHHTNLSGSARSKQRSLIKSVRIMKLMMLFIVAACMQVSAKGYAQTLSVSLKNAPLEKAFEQIEKQSRYRFAYTQEEIERSVAVTVNLKNAELKTVLEECFKEQPLSYKIEDNHIVVQLKEENKVAALFHEVKGRVTNAAGDPVAGITITVKESKKIAVTDKNGEFRFENLGEPDILVISGAEIESQEIKVSKRNYITITVIAKVNELDQVLVMAYGETSKRLSTGNISKVSGEEISRQPVSNPLAALAGRVPGLVVTQTSGVPGSSIKIQIRGQNSISQGSDPLFIIDGVPYSPGNAVLSQLSSAANNPFQTSEGGLSPFNLINPQDIESIEVLKDADMTAIYGSRGANGVILITTKKGKKGKTQISANLYSGWSKVARTMDMMNTRQYLEMRREAFKNDNATITASRAPDLLVWDTTRNTDFKDLLIGGTAKTIDAMVFISGGSENTQFSLSAGYRRETTVFPGSMAANRGSFHYSLNHSSSDKRFGLTMTVNYASERNNLNSRDLTSALILPPDFPSLYDSTGKLKWKEGTVTFSSLGLQNPFAYLLQKYVYNANNLTGNLQLSYKIGDPLIFRTSIGYNSVYTDEHLTIPIAAQDPSRNPTGISQFSNGNLKSWITEPQLEYFSRVWKGKLNIVIGTTFQEKKTASLLNRGDGYTNDAFLESLSGAATITSSNAYKQYRYYAYFGRINYNWSEKYILNFSGRRDGSSRFGPGKRFENFGAIGTAWIFSNEKFVKSQLPFLSFGKIRSSYGITGNDQIGDYFYLDSWVNAFTQYQNAPTLTPDRLYNPDYHWEINRKFEVAIDLGFLKDRIIFSAAWFRNQSSNQLIDYRLPTQSGFGSVFQNSTATVRNEGAELYLSGKISESKNFKWSASLNLTFPKNKLISFPNLAKSSYSGMYIESRSLSVINAFRFLGVDPMTGIYQFEDINKDGLIEYKTDYQPLGDRDPKCFGGLRNSITYRNWEIDIFAEFRKQTGRSYLTSSGNFIPGFRFNQPQIVTDRWQKAGDIAGIQQYTQTFTAAYFSLRDNLYNSDGAYTDASFFRLKNISISYQVDKFLLSKLKISSVRVYIQAQNLFTITKYKGADPENQNLYILPPLKTIAAGIKLTI